MAWASIPIHEASIMVLLKTSAWHIIFFSFGAGYILLLNFLLFWVLALSASAVSSVLYKIGQISSVAAVFPFSQWWDVVLLMISLAYSIYYLLVPVQAPILTNKMFRSILVFFGCLCCFLELGLLHWRRAAWRKKVIISRREALGATLMTLSPTSSSFLTSDDPRFITNALLNNSVFELPLPKALVGLVASYLVTPKVLELGRDDWTAYLNPGISNSLWFQPSDQEGKEKIEVACGFPDRIPPVGRTVLKPRIGSGPMPELIFPVAAVNIRYLNDLVEFVIDAKRAPDEPRTRSTSSLSSSSIVQRIRIARNLHALASWRNSSLGGNGKRTNSCECIFPIGQETTNGGGMIPRPYSLMEFERHAIFKGKFGMRILLPRPHSPLDLYLHMPPVSRRVIGDITVTIGSCEWFTDPNWFRMFTPPLFLHHARLTLV